MAGQTMKPWNRLFPLKVLPRRLRYRFHRDVLKSETAIARVLDFEMELPLQVDGIGGVLMVFGERELDQYFIIEKVLRQGDVVMDIGGNIGYYCSMELKIIGATGKIYCFEPDTRNIPLLKKNILRNGGKDIVEVIKAPVADRVEEIDFNIAEASNLSAMHITRSDKSDIVVKRGMHNRSYIRTTKITTVDFWDFVQNAERPIDLVRMDIEGYEAVLFEHLANQLERSKDFERAPKAFVFEPHSWEYEPKTHLLDSLTRLIALGYNITYLGSRSEPGSPIAERGYKPIKFLTEKRGVTRGVFADLPQAEAAELATCVDGITTICLQLQR